MNRPPPTKAPGPGTTLYAPIRPAGRGLVVASVIAAVVLGSAAWAFGDPPAAALRCTEEPCHFKSAATVKTDGGSELRVPPGYFTSEKTWSKLDLEIKRLQAREVDAKNAEAQPAAPSFVGRWAGWASFGAGFVAGFYLASKL